MRERLGKDLKNNFKYSVKVSYNINKKIGCSSTLV
jgi:hypothetical protein